MASVFGAVFEEFEQELGAIKVLIEFRAEPRPSARARVAGANASVLLLAATFEEFVRELAREFARAVVAATPSYDRLPPKLAAVAWKRAMDGLSRMSLGPRVEALARESNFADAQTRFSVIYDFCRGNLTLDIYQELIHNENNMRPEQLNSLFKVSGLGGMCGLAAEHTELKAFLEEDDSEIARQKLVGALESFFDRRNQTAHAVRAMSSASPETIIIDINFLRALGRALVMTLEAKSPEPIERV